LDKALFIIALHHREKKRRSGAYAEIEGCLKASGRAEILFYGGTRRRQADCRLIQIWMFFGENAAGLLRQCAVIHPGCIFEYDGPIDLVRFINMP
jgi:hypothetical protein